MLSLINSTNHMSLRCISRLKMEKLISSWVNNQSVPESYIFPLEKRPSDVAVPTSNKIPVVDLGGVHCRGCDQAQVINQILRASEEFGFFQLVNHGVPEKTIHDVMSVAEEFFEMPVEERAKLYSDDRNQIVRVNTSIDYNNEDVHFWRENLRHPCHPLEKFVHLWPEKPSRYRDVIGTYSVEVRGLALRILELICEGLGLERDYFSNGLGSTQLMSINHYPKCPDPTLTLGLPKHCDPNVITLLLQGEVCGLQVFKDGEWMAVEALPNAFVVNLGQQMQIISNGQLKSVEHRVVTNSTASRTTIVTFIHPDNGSIIAPASTLVDVRSPPLYRAFQFQDFLSAHFEKSGDKESTLELFKL
ncbi:protein DMR6-LIKE OXYGENASE 2-like [Magnolia sinica]|uniref:protein DMR6-LIKE OXYGENASE 2-like n=1 Tax=Magnolia sinica TaxID=86752 RepID=UPI002658267F|nr:protein DMR6-LIKE OXYGENASE 2-like [Magnolia sinica]